MDVAEGLVDRFVATLIEWVAPSSGTSASDPIERAMRKLTDPIVAAADEGELDRAFSAATRDLPEFLREVSRLPLFTEQHTSDAVRRLPWLMEHVAGDLDAGTLPHEFLALLLLLVRVFERLVRKAPPHVVARATEMRREDVLAAQRDPIVAPLFEAVTALFALASIHDRLGRADAWRRVRIMTRALDGLRVSAAGLPEERSFPWYSWFFQTLRELGLWLKSATPPVLRADADLPGDTPNRATLETLRARFNAAQVVVYVGDVQHTFEQVLGGARFFRDLHEWLRAGEAYERGELSVAELARSWSLDVPDTIARLEELKIVRPLDVLRLTESDRRQRLARLRADRLARRGEPAFDPEAVRRDVIASQRIEGIDARSHLPGTARERP